MPLGEVRTGKNAILGDKKRGGGKYTSKIYWKKDETKNVFFLTPIDEVKRVMMHTMVKKVIETDDGSERTLWLDFMCRKDPGWLEESQGECPLCDDIGLKPTERVIAMGVEVEPVMDGKRVKKVEIKYRKGTDREGKEQDYPEVGVIMQASHNFYQYLLTQSERRDIADVTWEITREGDGLQTKYGFYPIEMAPENIDTIEAFVPDVYDYLDELGSAERYDTEMEGIRASDQPNFGGKRGRGKQKTEELEPSTIFDGLKDKIEQNKRPERY